VTRQPTSARIVAIAIAIVIVIQAGVAAAQPARALAKEHNRRGAKLLVESPRDLAAAELAFETAYSLDPDPMFLFNLALARRLGGKCREAIETYRAYLRTDPPEADAANARIGIERCEQTLATTTPPTGQPIATAIDKPIDPSLSPSPHWSGSVLLVTGGVSTIASVTLYILARRAGSSTFDAGPLAEHELQRDRAATLQTATWITAGAAGLMVAAGGAIYLLTRRGSRPPVEVGVETKQSGAALVVGGSF
jgi:hypothetical protein